MLRFLFFNVVSHGKGLARVSLCLKANSSLLYLISTFSEDNNFDYSYCADNFENAKT